MMFHCEVLKTKGMYRDTAGQFIKMTNEVRLVKKTQQPCLYLIASILFSGIGFEERVAAGAGCSLLPQAAHADAAQVLLPHDPGWTPLQQGWPGLQWHTHTCISRYPKGKVLLSVFQRRHAMRAYAQALQTFKGKGWFLAEVRADCV